MIAYAAVTTAFAASCVGTCYFAAVLMSRALDAHDRGMTRVRNHNRRNTTCPRP